MRRGLQAGEISSAYLPGWGTDEVIKQDPPAGTTDNVSPHVDFLVSLGGRPAAYVMPELVGLTLDQAEAKLKSAGLHLGKFTPSSVVGVPRGSVVGQTPARGQRVDANSNIELQVAE
jgi:eukaryotic-like serine/threonine-protein kinase